MTINQEKEILKRVQERIDHKEDLPEDVTIDSLVERKRSRERTYHSKKERIETDAMIGTDIELDLDVDDL